MPFIVILIAVLIAAADQVVKYFVSVYLAPAGTVEVIPGLFSLTYVENRGAAFGMMANMRWIFIVFTVIVIGVFVYILFKKKIKSKLFMASAALLIGGGIGNLIDRIFTGYVVDYLSLSFFSPVCNLADYCITAGTVILIVYLIFFSDFFKSDKKVKKND